MVEAAKAGKPSPMIESYILSLCRVFHCLPSQIMDEDIVLIDNAITFASAHGVVTRLLQAKGEAIHDLSPSDATTIAELEKMGINPWGV